MRLPDAPTRLMQTWLILLQEIRGLLLSPALWLQFIVLSLLTGYGFIQAVDLYSQASRTALNYPQLATGMNPLDGILVPTFGAFYLTQTLLLPFIAIQVIGRDKQSGALKLLLQLPLPPFALCGLKLLVLLLVWLVSLLPAAVTLLLWHSHGGHLYLPEVLLLLTGHGLHALTIITIALFAAAVTNSLPTAAMGCLAVTLGSWVLDFALAGRGEPGDWLSNLSLAGMLHRFETGLFSSGALVSFLALAGLFFLLTVIWLHPGRHLRAKLVKSLICLSVLFLLAWGAVSFPVYRDLSENRRHSLNPADTRALHRLDKPLTLTIHLAPQDSRLLDLQQDLLAKLRRTVPDLRVHFPEDTPDGLFDTGGDRYGLIEISYNGQHDQTYSNSREEILPMIHGLAGLQVTPDQTRPYPGYPLVADSGPDGVWFYIVLPTFFLSVGLFSYRKLH